MTESGSSEPAALLGDALEISWSGVAHPLLHVIGVSLSTPFSEGFEMSLVPVVSTGEAVEMECLQQ